MAEINWEQKVKEALNLETAETKKRIDPGTYEAQVLEADVTKSSTGNDQIKMVYEITEGDEKGFKLWDYATFSEKGSTYAIKKLIDIGVDPEHINGDMESIAGKLFGKKLQVVVQDREWDGEIRSNVKYVNPTEQPPSAVESF